jgi:dTDP-4-dehydrorhamnose reductase
MKKNKILLIGGSGNLGNKIIESNLFKDLYAPKKKILNLLNSSQIFSILKKKNINTIIHCASLARMKECENDIAKTINNNILGTYNLVKAIIELKKKIKIIYLSSDAVYPSVRGNYKENGDLGPYNNYGWSKLSAEFLIKMISDHVIIRTRFYDKDKINYRFSASDIFTSQIEIRSLVKYIYYLILDNFIGTINIGGKRVSDFKLYKKIKPKLKSFKRKDLIKKLNFKIAKDASLNLIKFNKIKKNYE